MSTLNVFAVAKILVYALFGIGLPSSALYLGVFLPYSRCVLGASFSALGFLVVIYSFELVTAVCAHVPLSYTVHAAGLSLCGAIVPLV